MDAEAIKSPIHSNLSSFSLICDTVKSVDCELARHPLGKEISYNRSIHEQYIQHIPLISLKRQLHFTAFYDDPTLSSCFDVFVRKVLKVSSNRITCELKGHELFIAVYQPNLTIASMLGYVMYDSLEVVILLFYKISRHIRFYTSRYDSVKLGTRMDNLVPMLIQYFAKIFETKTIFFPIHTTKTWE